MRTTFCQLLFVVIFVVSSISCSAQSGFFVANGRLFDANSQLFVMRGVNHMHTWYRLETDSIDNISTLGANTVRVVLASGDRWASNSQADVQAVIQRCKDNDLICMLEVHDTTGFGDEPAAATLAQAVDYWISIAPALHGQEEFVLLNIGNEPYGNNSPQLWRDDTIDAIIQLRNAGFGHTIVVDAPNWGQDWTGTMRNNAAAVFAADPDANIVFSVHMYGVYGSSATISSYLSSFVTGQLPIIVGEFGFFHSDGDVDEDFILSFCQSAGIGYLGWAWSGNGGGVEYLDMVENFDPNQLTTWGQRIFQGPNGIQETAMRASVFDGVLLGDVNLDGQVNLLDVEPFINVLSNGPFQAEADTNEDGQVNLLDVEPFIGLLSG